MQKKLKSNNFMMSNEPDNDQKPDINGINEELKLSL